MFPPSVRTSKGVVVLARGRMAKRQSAAQVPLRGGDKLGLAKRTPSRIMRASTPRGRATSLWRKLGDSDSTRSIAYTRRHGDGQETGVSTAVADVGDHGAPSDERRASLLRTSRCRRAGIDLVDRRTLPVRALRPPLDLPVAAEGRIRLSRGRCAARSARWASTASTARARR